MFNILKKYNLITVLPFENTFFYTVVMPKQVKLTKEVVSLNFLKFSPYKNPSIIIKFINKKMLLWFYESDIKTAVAIPESYIAYKGLLNNKEDDALYVINDETIKVIAIKNSSFVGAFTLKNIDENTIKISMDEYELNKKVFISKDEYYSILEASKESLNFSDIYSFSQLDLDKKNILKKLIDVSSYPIAGAIVLAIFISYVQGSILNQELDELTSRYQEEKAKNKEIKQEIKKHNKEVKKYKSFIDTELKFIQPISILESIYGIFEKGDKATLKYITINDTNIKLIINTDENPVKYLNRLNSINYFKQVIIQSTRKPKHGLKSITYEIETKLLKNV